MYQEANPVKIPKIIPTEAIVKADESKLTIFQKLTQLTPKQIAVVGGVIFLVAVFSYCIYKYFQEKKDEPQVYY